MDKLEAARAQMEAAVRLFFQDAHPVPVHTLVAAAYRIIQDVNKHRGGPAMLIKDLIPRAVPEAKRASVCRKLNAAENFFKHADRDADKVLGFRPDQTEMLIFDASLKYHELTGEMPDAVKVFLWWLSATKREVFELPEALRGRVEALAPGRKAFFSFMYRFAETLPDFFGASPHDEAAEFVEHLQRYIRQAGEERSGR